MATEVKICGITSPEALSTCIRAGVDYFGLVLAKSRRRVSLEQAAALAAETRGKILSVALVVDADDALIAEIARTVRPDWLQLHGRESVDRVGDVRRRWQIPIIKAVSVATAEDVERAQAYDAPGVLADIVLLDAKPPKDAAQAGGHGQTFDWTLLQPLRGRRFALAGGLDAENVAEAIRQTGAAMVDVSSGVEATGMPGIKDPAKIIAFINAAKAANTAPTPA